MATFLKCKMCGGDISVNSDMNVGTCQYCGSTMTIPHIDSEKKARIFNRANQYRVNCEFDKAYDSYKIIADEDPEESEAYWGMVLSEYGVEYVEDPTTKKRIPTCHRTVMKSVKSNSNYQLAYRYADAECKMLYRDEAEELDRIQKGILAISNKEKPYDIFICYKESDDMTGERTSDSILAQSIYDDLDSSGYNTFFARISLIDKLGENYEPYIYAALQSAKVMLVVGTSSEHLSSTWVKNEWSRYIGFMNEDRDKVLIPVYCDMQVHELPDELRGFQALDMSKVGALQDLLSSVKRIVKAKEASKKDIVIDEIIAERERAERLKEKKRYLINKIIRCALIFGCIVAVLGISVAITVYVRNKKIHDEDLAKREFLYTEGIPDSDKYDYFVAELTDENFSSFFEARKYHDTNGKFTYALYSLAYDKGWIMYDCKNLYCDFKFMIINSKYTGTISGNPFNSNLVLDSLGNINRQYHFYNCSGKLYFVSKNILEECTYKNGERTIKLYKQSIKESLSDSLNSKDVSIDDFYW